MNKKLCVALVISGFVLGFVFQFALPAKADSTSYIISMLEKIYKWSHYNKIAMKNSVLGPYGMQGDITKIKDDVSGTMGIGGIKQDVTELKNSINSMKVDISRIKSDVTLYCR